MFNRPGKYVIGTLLCCFAVVLSISCKQINFYANSGGNANLPNETVSENRENPAAPPFPTKEPEKFRAKFVFTSQIDADDESPIVQTTEIFRDGANRRIDFEAGENLKISRVQTQEGKEFIIITEKKVFTEVAKENKSLAASVPEDYSLEYLLHTKPIGANYEKISMETLDSKQVTKYRLNFGEIIGDANLTTETYIWVDENLGFPVKTEVISLIKGEPTNTKSTMETKDFSTEIAPGTFEIPKDFRKISFAEISGILHSTE